MSSEDKYDRVLCDVMCSGDGTLRKSIDLWPRWTPMQGPVLHGSQSRVLMRGMGLCKKGGIVVYSTCSLSPAEDEATVSSCIAQSKGAFELIDTSASLPELKRYPGAASWTILSRDGSKRLTCPEDGDDKRFTYPASMFPGTEGLPAAQHIERCIKVAPHQQDTGGFFIAALRCVEELEGSVSKSLLTRKREPPFAKLSEELQAKLRDTLELGVDFPWDRLYVASETARLPKVYYVSPTVQSVMATITAKVTSVGVKVIDTAVRRSYDNMRFATDGASTMATLVPQRLLIDVAAAPLVDAIIASTGSSDPTAKVMPVATFKSAMTPAATARFATEAWPRKNFIAAVDVPNGVGTMHLTGDFQGEELTLHVVESQLTVLKLALGLPIITATEDDKPEEGAADPEEGAGGAEEAD
jgi:tRNA (cytosine34-C5)-methyltransferase